MALVMWFVALVGLIVAAAFASGRGRATPNEVASRRVVATAMVAYAAIIAATAWLWGGATARDGREARLREGASVTVEIESVRVSFVRTLTFGHGDTADVRVPGDGAPELVRIELDANGVATVRNSVSTIVAPVGATQTPRAAATALRCATASGSASQAPAWTLPRGTAVVVLECEGDQPRAAFVVRREGERLAITPLVAKAGFVVERRALRAGDALRLGGADEPIPGLVTWDVIAPRGASAMLAIPGDPTECVAWVGESARAVEQQCQVGIGAFSLVATPFVPDDGAVLDRGFEIALLIGVPALLVLGVLVVAPRRARRASAFARALRLAALSGGLAALGCWRLLWAYRIDMFDGGTRVVDNQLGCIAVAAALAGAAVLGLDALDGRSLQRRVVTATSAWAAWLAVGCLIVGDVPALTATTIGVLGLSLIAALIPALGDIAVVRRVPPELTLAAIAAGALVAHATHHGGALAKLGLAYATVLAGHAALRGLLSAESSLLRRARLALALAAATACVAWLDAGVALAIVGTGLALAMLVAGHDALYDASQAGKLGVLEREHARLLIVHGVAAALLAIGVAACALIVDDRTLREHGALAVLHAPLVVAGLFGLAALVARSQRRSWAPWLAAALAAFAAWGARDLALERATAGDGVASRRVSAIVEPGYALLRDDRAFVANATAWREAALAPANGSEADTQRGQGYFGARIRDPGVARSIDNDYLPVLVAREGGVTGLMQGVLLLLALIVGGGALASVRLRHASREHRARWLVTAVAGALAVYQPLAALGVLPLTGISWPGLGIDSPADLWLFVIGATWCWLGADGAHDDERVRQTPRLARARRVVLIALVLAGVAAVIVVVRAGACALVRASDDDARVATALRYASSLECATPDRAGTLDEVLPVIVAGKPSDAGTLRYERELNMMWKSQRATLIDALTERPKSSSSDAPTGTTRTSSAIPVTFANNTSGAPMLRFINDDEPDGTAKPKNTPRFDDNRTRAGKTKPGANDRPVEDKTRAANPDSGSRTADDKRISKADDAGKGRKPTTGKPAAKPASGDRKLGDRKADDKRATRGGKRKGAKGAGDDPKDDSSDTRDDRTATDIALDFFDLDAPADAPPPQLTCPTKAGAWRIVRSGDQCIATLPAGWPQVKLAIRRTPEGVHARCSVALPDDAVSALRTTVRAPRPRIRVVSVPVGISADDVGEVAIGHRIIRLRAGAPERELSALGDGLHVAGSLSIAGTTKLELRATPRAVVLHGPAELFVADGVAWRRTLHAGEIALDRISLIAAGSAERRVVVLFRPPRVWGSGPAILDSLLADTAGDRARRIYPHGAAIPELGWVNPYDVDRSLGLDGWIHAAQDAKPPTGGTASCGTLAPPPIARERVCSASPLDGVTECRVSLQPQLAFSLRALAEQLLDEPKPLTGRDTHPVRVAYVAMRGDTGEILAQGNLVPGRPALAFAPRDPAAEAALVRLRDEPGEAHAERVEWNLPIAVGSTFKPVVARAAEQAFPQHLATLTLTAAGHATGCRQRRGIAIDPIAGHCPPTSVAGMPTTADLHDFLARSPNWYQAALGILGLGMPDAQLTVDDQQVTIAGVVGSDLATWPADKRLLIADAKGPILGKRALSIDGMRRTPLWKRIEALLGRPICTLGDRGSCERAAQRADTCAARALPIAHPGPDLKNLVSLGPDRINPYPGDRAKQTAIPVREYFQLLRGSGVHPVGSLAQITDAFGRVVYDPTTTAPKLAASWFPAPAVGKVPDWSCVKGTGHANTVLGADGGLCGVVRPNGTAHAMLKDLLADPNIVIYAAKTGTIDSLADIARNRTACRRWNESHVPAAQLECGRAPPDDSLFVIAFGVVTPRGTIPITLGLQLQRAGKSAASKATPAFVRAVASYLRN